MMVDNKFKLAQRVIESINCCSFLRSRITSDFSRSSKIEILVSCPHPSSNVYSFVSSHLTIFELSHLVFLCSDEEANVSYWRLI